MYKCENYTKTLKLQENWNSEKHACQNTAAMEMSNCLDQDICHTKLLQVAKNSVSLLAFASILKKLLTFEISAGTFGHPPPLPPPSPPSPGEYS